MQLLSKEQPMKNFIYIGKLDIMELLKEIELHSELWNQNNLRTCNMMNVAEGVSDIWISFPDYKKHITNLLGMLDDLTVIDYPAKDILKSVAPIVQQVMALTGGKELNRVLITAIKPGGRILPHTDAGEFAKVFERFHVVLQSDEGNVFRTEGEFVHMKPGELWWFNNLNEHELYNGSSRARIHLVLDIKG